MLRRRCSSKRMCELWPSQRRKNSTVEPKMMPELAWMKEKRAQDWITVIEKE